MGVANTKSTQVSNGDASPPVLNPTYAGGGGVLRRLAGTVETAAADELERAILAEGPDAAMRHLHAPRDP